MKTVAVISEFNLFHHGHLSLIKHIRQAYGIDTCIIAVMSGNYTQRGDVAFVDKFIRAEAAVEAGINLVLELPFPFSSAGADYFARAGVHIASSLGGVDALAFGSECGDLSLLEMVSANLSSAPFLAEMKKRLSSKEEKKKGYALIQEEVYEALFGTENLPLLRKPNNILAVQYLRALSLLSSPLIPFTVKRADDYHIKDASCAVSATAVRHALLEGRVNDARALIPREAFYVYERAINAGLLPCTLSRLSGPILAALRLHSQKTKDDLFNRLSSLSSHAKNIDEVLSLASTKRYTNAHIRRSLWYSLFGVTSTDLDALPQYTQILAMDTVGQKKLAEIRKKATISLLSKPADHRAFSPLAQAQASLSQKADSLFALSSVAERAGDYAILSKPYRKI